MKTPRVIQSVAPTVKTQEIAVELRSYPGGPPSHRAPFLARPSSPGSAFPVYPARQTSTPGTSSEDPICLDNDDEAPRGRRTQITLENPLRNHNPFLTPQRDGSKTRPRLSVSPTVSRGIRSTAQPPKHRRKKSADQSHRPPEPWPKNGLLSALQHKKEMGKQVTEASEKLDKGSRTYFACDIPATLTADMMIAFVLTHKGEIQELRDKLAESETTISYLQIKASSDAKSLQELENQNKQLAAANRELKSEVARIAQDSETQINQLNSENAGIVDDLRTQLSDAAEEVEALRKKDAENEASIANLSKERDDLLQELRDKKAALTQETEKLSCLEEHLALTMNQHQTDIEALEQKQANASKDLASSVKEFDEVKVSLDQHRARIDTLERKEAEQSKDLDAKIKELEEANASLDEQKAKIGALEENEANLSRDLDTRSKELEKAEASLSQHKTKIDALHEENQKTFQDLQLERQEKSSLEDAWTQKEAGFKKEIAENKTELEKKTWLVKTWEERVGKLNEEKVKTAKEAKAKYDRDLAVKEEVIEEFKKCQQQFENQIESLRKEKQESDKLAKEQISKLEDEKSGMAQKLASMKEELQSKAKQVEQSNNLVAAAEKLNVKVGEELLAERKMAEEKSTLFDIQTNLFKLKSEKLQQETQLVTELEERITALNADKTDTSAELERCKQQVKELEERVTSLNADKTKLSTELERQKPVIKSLENRLTELQTVHITVSNHLHARSAELQKQTQLTKNAERRVDELQQKTQRADELEKQIAALETEKWSMSAKAAELEKKTNACEEENVRFAVEVENLTAEVENLTAQLEAELQEKSRELSRYDEQLASVKAEYESQVEKLKDQNRQLSEQAELADEQYGRAVKGAFCSFLVTRRNRQTLQDATLGLEPRRRRDPELDLVLNNPEFVASLYTEEYLSKWGEPVVDVPLQSVPNSVSPAPSGASGHAASGVAPLTPISPVDSPVAVAVNTPPQDKAQLPPLVPRSTGVRFRGGKALGSVGRNGLTPMQPPPQHRLSPSAADEIVVVTSGYEGFPRAERTGDVLRTGSEAPRSAGV